MLFINIIKEEYEKNFLLLVFMFYILFIDQVSYIINNGNILTDGRWRCYNEMGVGGGVGEGYVIDTANYKHVRNRF